MSDFSKAGLPPAEQSNSSRDVIFAVGILVILAVLFLPIPPMLIDVGLAISIALSVLILMVALWIQKPLDFSSFPTILLIATMLRLSLNISTTRLILANGSQGEHAAGGIIQGFASFVMSGDFVIGVIVFIILVTVNFVVITKGATRIAEVGARFTLDAIPGKQMAIDADLSAGLLDEKEAQARRRELEEESSFFGSMDGASKFVRGDAIAGLIITAVNIVGGIVIGVWRNGMEFSEAADVFVKLSVGDGLVSQIPALIISLAAGLLVSKGGTRGSADRAVLGQLTNYPKALYMAAGLLGIFAITPNLPFLPFALLGVASVFTGYLISKSRLDNAALEKRKSEEADMQKLAEKQDSVKSSLEVAKLELVLGKQLKTKMLMNENEMGFRISRMRKKFAKAFGFVIPEIKISEDLTIDPRTYQIRVFGTTVASSQVSLTDVIVIANSDTPPALPYEEVVEPAFNTKAWQIPDSYVGELEQLGYQSVDAMSQILTHLSEAIKNNLSQLFSYKDMRYLIEGLDKEYMKLVDEICPAHLSFSGLQAVFKLLLAERVSVRNVTQLLEAIAEVAPYSKRGEQIVTHVRTRIAQQICGDLMQDGQLKLLRLGNEWENAFASALQRDQRGEVMDFQMAPEELEKFGAEASEKIQNLIDDRQIFAISTSPENRSYVRMIIERLFPTLPVISNLEIARGMDVKIIGSVAE
ncbi:MAG: flagellar biosynthesis protein FlhA [Pseudomonadota bacterium]